MVGIKNPQTQKRFTWSFTFYIRRRGFNMSSDMSEAAKKKLNLEKAANFMRQYRDPTSRELKKLSANQFMEVWSHYDKDGTKKMLITYIVRLLTRYIKCYLLIKFIGELIHSKRQVKWSNGQSRKTKKKKEHYPKMARNSIQKMPKPPSEKKKEMQGTGNVGNGHCGAPCTSGSGHYF
ncbi:hypothetical protein RUM43_012675 [Polyplax serrata]|uniref:EF-hand domain-containing protein n=1 Tax=Polyplax serrata TaxID=468196 RepID=A0AAN8P129_POLSC